MDTATVLKDLSLRGILKDYTNNIESFLSSGEKVKVYLGIDPTASSIHIGNLVPLITLIRLQKYGYEPFLLIGGATGMIGDPSFKSSERVFLDEQTIIENQNSIRKQLEKLVSNNCSKPFVILNNKDWFSEMNTIQFLREAGKNINISYMLTKESIKRRINNSLSFTEFSYQILQAYDFFYLNDKYGVNLQLGGGDQWGNITTGVDFVRRKSGKEVHALSTILLTKKDGTKFGKTEGGAIWLDANKTSPYEFYQYWINLSDDDAKKCIAIYSQLPLEQIRELISQQNSQPERRFIQRQLAKEMTLFVHGAEEYERIEKSSEIIFGNSSYEDLCRIDNIRSFLHNIANAEINREQFFSFNSIFEMLAHVCVPAFFPSRNELKRHINDNCITINKRKYKMTDPVSSLDLIDDCILIQKGKKNYFSIFINGQDKNCY